MNMVAYLAALMAVAGVGQALAGCWLVRRFRTRAVPQAGDRPPVTILKPLFGAEPLLEQALATLCTQEYGTFQIVFGVHGPRDPAVAVVRRLQARFPDCDIALVVDPTPHGRNNKVGNLINMLAAARHDILVIADSDVHVAPDYLARVVDTLQRPGVGLATTLYAGLPASASLAGSLGATGITHSFLPGALIARALGRQDCLGATMALRRETLDAIGGFAAIADDLADDAALGRLVRAQGLSVALANTVPATTVPEERIGALFSHELRWARIIVSLAPVPFALSVVQYPLAWALLCLALSGGAEWAWLLLLGVWFGRAALGRGIDRALALTRSGFSRPAPILLLPVRDLLSVAVLLASYASDQVHWRGAVLRVGVEPSHMGRMNPLSLGSEP
jgi:ceramide glucosyltransferase